jgi:8-oxo-dGTP pyrophosphatase MutT (NUDIX family)
MRENTDMSSTRCLSKEGLKLAKEAKKRKGFSDEKITEKALAIVANTKPNETLDLSTVQRFFQKRKSTGNIRTYNFRAILEVLELDEKQVTQELPPLPIIGKPSENISIGGNPELGEIELVEKGENLITEEQHFPTSKYVGVAVDKVRFRQFKPDNTVGITDGKYVRIYSPSAYDGGVNGAVVLPIDPETGRVLMVCQYRHSQRHRGDSAFMVEVPRGFSSLGIDKDSEQVARRELEEETGVGDKMYTDKEGNYQIYLLKTVVPDSGKLCDSVDLYLCYVNPKFYNKETRSRPSIAMEDTFWVNFETFMEAIYSSNKTGVTARKGDFEYLATEAEYKNYFRPLWHRPIADNIGIAKRPVLLIEDSFTIQTALLAIPLLYKKFIIEDGGKNISQETFISSTLCPFE